MRTRRTGMAAGASGAAEGMADVTDATMRRASLSSRLPTRKASSKVSGSNSRWKLRTSFRVAASTAADSSSTE